MAEDPAIDVCPECGHTIKVRNRPAWLVRLIGDRPPRPYCDDSDSGANPSGWPEACGCRHPSHAR